MYHRYKCKMEKLLEENRVEKSLWPVVWQRVLRQDTKKMTHKRKMSQLDFIRIKTFCSVKCSILSMKRQATCCKKILGNHLFHKGLGKARIYKAFSKFSSKKTTQLKDGQKTWASAWSIVTAWPFARCFLGLQVWGEPYGTCIELFTSAQSIQVLFFSQSSYSL